MAYPIMKSTVASLLWLAQRGYGSGSSWDYDHMSAWSNQYSMCGVENQSPIDIVPYTAVFDQDICTAEFDWEVDFTKQTFKIVNNGHSIALKPIQHMEIDPDLELDSTIVDVDGNEYEPLTESENVIARLPNYFRPGSSKHDSFCLDSFHFHWGLTDDTGSEHFIDGHQYPLELHFVHYSCEHASLAATLEQFPTLQSVSSANDDGVDTHQLGVVGVFFEVVDNMTNPAFDAIFTNETMHQITLPGGGHSHESAIVFDLNLADLIPEDLWTSGYYSYEGSLTTPPCTDIVRWHVMNARGYIGRHQLEMFRDLMSTAVYPIAPNYRELQSNPSTVYGCIGDAGSDEADEEDSESDSQGLSWWAVAIISSLATAVVMGAIFLCVYKKQEREFEDDLASKRAEMGRKATSNSDVYSTTR